MYPNLYYFLKETIGVDIPGLKIVNTFGFCVAIAFLATAYFITKELKRREKLGLFLPELTEIEVGKPASVKELALNFLLGFILGFKIVGIFFTDGALKDPQGFVFSSNGNFLCGILVGLLFLFLKWSEKNKQKLEKPVVKKYYVWPSERVGDIVIISAVGGFAGAKIFDNLENWDRFIQDPIGNLFSASGLTYYGGLIVASISLWYYFRKHNISFIRMADACAAPLMLAYGMGRIGCEVAGDGDWGIVNTRPKPFAAFPDWLWASDYAHNVNKEGVPLPGCTWDDFCTHLPQPVFPTPLYEIIAGILLFLFLWSIRKKVTTVGKLFGAYLLVNGIERLLVEQIRVNTTYTIFGFHPTQAEIIAVFLIIGGIALIFKSGKWFNQERYPLPKPIEQ